MGPRVVTVPPERVEVAVVGGGLGGLALTIALRARGVDAHIFERFPALCNQSQGTVVIWPNGMKALQGVDPNIPERIKAAGSPCGAVSSTTDARGGEDHTDGHAACSSEASTTVLTINELMIITTRLLNIY